MDVALVTCSAIPDLDPDDRTLEVSLATRKLDARPVVWDDPSVDWGAVGLALIRNTWDYHLRRDAFLAWAERASKRTLLFNALEAVRWNTHKGYLRELAALGLPVVPTLFVPSGGRLDLAAAMREREWPSVVIKPAVSLDSWETIRADETTVAAGQAHLDRLSPAREMMVQPYLEAVATSGERCLVFLDGDLSHAVRKRSLFLGGRHAGPEGIAVPIEEDEAAVARRIVGSLPWPTLYARVDLVRDGAGRPLLLELELVEPTLFLGAKPDAADRLARAVETRIALRGR